MISGVAIEIATFGEYTFALGFHEAAGLALMTSGCTQAMHHAKDISLSYDLPKTHSMDWNIFKSETKDKKHTPDQEALSDLAKEKERKGITNDEADNLLEWADEYDFPARDDRGKDHWNAKDGVDHIHLGPKHIPVID
jgi:hypothetical protein